MAVHKILVTIVFYHLFHITATEKKIVGESNINKNSTNLDERVADVFEGVYSECLLKFSYVCLQKKTLLYLKSLNRLSEISIIGDYVKFVKINASESKEEELYDTNDTEDLSNVIDRAVDTFFENHLIRFSGLGEDVLVPNTVEEFVGRKKRKGGGGHGGGDGDDGGKKKMFMMAMMCMKMKMMIMVPAMMGMMGMMSFKGMMFSMMSFMISKMMLLMKLLEKKGGGGGSSWSGGGDGGWASSSNSGAWMPAASPDYSSGGYDSNGQWQSRSIIEMLKDEKIKPKISYVKPINPYTTNPYIKMDKRIKENEGKFPEKPKLRRKRSIVDTLRSAYMYWISKILGINRTNPKFKMINGVKYVYLPNIPNKRAPKTINNNMKPLVITEDFNKGEIVEGPVEGRMIRRKFNKMKENVNEAVDENPWE